jgi:membrane-bound lytic murein transglycosylase D
MDALRLLKRARVGIVLPVLVTTTVATTAVISGVEGTSYIRSAAGTLDLALQPRSSGLSTSVEADSAVPSPPAFALPKLGNIAKAFANPIVARKPASRSSLNVTDVNHPRIQQWVQRLTTTHKKSYLTSLVRMEKYEAMISSKLAARKMPQELIYLAMIESNFNPDAKSPVAAVGLWQFMTATAQRFGLKVRGRIDERRDPARATDAALTYLSSLYNRFGSWYLAAAAYNSGEGTVLKALRKVTGNSVGTDADFFRILPTLPRETQDYVPKLIASARVGQAPERYGFTVQPAGNVLSRTPVTRHKTLAQTAAKHTTVGKAKSTVDKRSVVAAKKKIATKATPTRQRHTTG